MRFEVCEYSPQFYCVRGLNKALIEYLRLSVKQSLRFYENNAWHIHTTQVVKLTQLGYAEFGHVDYSALPDEEQMFIAQEKHKWHQGDPCKSSLEVLSKAQERSNAFEVLHLHPEAPAFIVEAVWRALAKQHHPDRGGDEELFKKYSAAYKVVKE